MSLSQQIPIFFAMTIYTLITTNWQPAASVLSYLDKCILFALSSVLVTSVWITIRMPFMGAFSCWYQGLTSGLRWRIQPKVPQSLAIAPVTPHRVRASYALLG